MWGAERKDDKLFRCKKKKKKGNADVEQREGEFYLFQHGYVIKKQ